MVIKKTTKKENIKENAIQNETEMNSENTIKINKKTNQTNHNVSVKKNHAKIIHHEPEKKINFIFPLIIILGIILISIGAIYLFNKMNQNDSDNKDVALVIVNGETIYQSELDESWNTLSPTIKVSVSRADLLEQLIDGKLLLQKSAEKNIVVTQENIDEFIELELANSGLSKEEFETKLSEVGKNYDDVLTEVNKTLKIEYLLKQEVFDKIEVTQEEISKYYDENQDKFVKENSTEVTGLNDIIPELEGNYTLSDLIEQIIFQDKIKEAYLEYVKLLRVGTTINYVADENSINAETIIDEKETESVDDSIDVETLAKCLTEKGAKMYGAYWCSHCNNQKEGFGDAVKYIDYVECDAGGENAQVDLCIEKGVEGFPTWIINDKSYSGEQSHENLAKLAGC